MKISNNISVAGMAMSFLLHNVKANNGGQNK
jgi:hypothetical protein